MRPPVILMVGTRLECRRRSFRRPEIVINLFPERRGRQVLAYFTVWRCGQFVSFRQSRGYPFSQQVRVLTALLSSDKALHAQDLVSVLYGDDPEGGALYADHLVTRIMMKLRPKLSEIGLHIPVSHPRRGYWIVDLWADQSDLREAA